MTHRAKPLLAVVLTAGLSAIADAQSRPPPQPDLAIDAATRAQVIDRALAALTRDYVFPEIAAKVATAIHDSARSARYDAITSAIQFADRLTADLQAISHDKHMRVAYSARPVPDQSPHDGPPTEAERARSHAMAQRTNAAFVKVERLPGNIGYLRLDQFQPPDEAGPRAAAAMSFLADTDALILDLRNNHGGEPASVALLVSYLYDDAAQIHINDIYWHLDNSTRQYWTVSSLPGRRYPGKPVYVLTSHDTFSGGEECAYDLQSLKRATLVGEITGGGANPGNPVKVAEHFTVFVPTGRAVNPVTRTSWEGVGVKPDIIAPAARALDVAYRAALRDQQARISAQDAPGLRAEIDQALDPRR
ncbi:MAG TPA: S41 family peptidase [Kofleriaceae bacterium]|jgi:hypothetical protein|nr:S41 family peptidase [Kofleriaceae bacterium]